MLQAIGYYTEQDATQGEIKISIPLVVSQKWYVVKSDQRKSEDSPTHHVFFDHNRIGGLWEGIDKNGNKYFSGNVYCPLFDKGKFLFKIFQEDRKSGKIFVVKIALDEDSK